MTKLIKLSFSMFKNLVLSKENIIGVIISLLYSLLWIRVVHPEQYLVLNYTTEYFRLLYILIIYLSFQLLDVDVKNNIHISLFTGVFTRVQIIVSKFISLLFMGVYFALIGEFNNLMVCLLSKNKFSIESFLKINHVNFVLSVIIIVFTMGSLCLLILSCKLKSKIIITICTVFLGFLNFCTTYMVVLYEFQNNPITPAISVYMKTPMYITTKLMLLFNLSNSILYLGWGLLFFFLFLFIMNRKEVS